LRIKAEPALEENSITLARRLTLLLTRGCGRVETDRQTPAQDEKRA
jgi:hypothetical protein